jgi:uncharacterized protein
MDIQKNTKIKDILSAYPWLKQELIQMNPKFKKLDSPVAKMLLKKATIQDACDKFNVTPEKLTGKLAAMIEKHENSGK